jgi:hypothetical protein
MALRPDSGTDGRGKFANDHGTSTRISHDRSSEFLPEHNAPTAKILTN